MKTVHTFCRICEPACGLQAQVENEQVVKILPDKSHPVHKGFACHKGVNFLQVHNDPDRLNVPLKRLNSRSEPEGDFVEVSWDEAIDDIAARIQTIQEKYGKAAVAGFVGNPTAFNSQSYMSFPALFAKLGSGRMFSSLTQDCSNKLAGSEAVFGSNNLHPIPDLLHTDYFLSIGCNPKISHMSFVHTADPMGKLRAITGRGGKVVFINPRKIESSTPATGEVVLIKPDTDVYFLAALIHHILQQPDYDFQALSLRGKHIEGLRAFVEAYSPERVETVTGIAADTIRQIATDFSAAGAASVHMSTGANMGRQGTLAYWLVHMLSLVSGNLGKRGGNIYSPGFFSVAQFGKKREGNPYFQTPFGEVRTVGGALPGNLIPEFIEAEQQPIRALIVHAGNPLLSVGGEAAIRRAFEKLELLVVIDIYRNATGELADYVLPGTDWLERPDVNSLSLGFQTEPFAQYSDRVVPPKAQRKEEWWILARIEQALGLPSTLDQDPPKPLAALDKMLASSGLSIARLKETEGNTVALPEADAEAIFKLGVQQKDGLIDCCPAEFAEALERSAVLFSELEQEPADQLKLINLRTNYMHNSWLSNLPNLKRGEHQRNPLWMHSTDASRLGLADGAQVVVKNAFGEIQAELKFDDSLRTGVVAMTHGWGNQSTRGMSTAQEYPGVNVNQLLPMGVGSFEKLSNQAHMTGVNVEVMLAS